MSVFGGEIRTEGMLRVPCPNKRDKPRVLFYGNFGTNDSVGQKFGAHENGVNDSG